MTLNFKSFEAMQMYICRFGGTFIGFQNVNDRRVYCVLQDETVAVSINPKKWEL